MARRGWPPSSIPTTEAMPTRMGEINVAFDAVVAESARSVCAGAASGPEPPPAPPRAVDITVCSTTLPSFTIDLLPVEAFEALLVVTSWIGEVLVDDPPYVLEVHLTEPEPVLVPARARARRRRQHRDADRRLDRRHSRSRRRGRP